ncbi:hypothetical protein Anas_03460 [Armadillidium nasatum]|uniref:Apolipoprotein D n=1 Tax=Armadillidium nasatum TaxID=96803 RepID=A0A5N5TM66_9CRUS|nr:hypothetical protein Anas_03460 [Armadillidium nasatum]
MKLNILLIAIFAISSQAEIRNGTCANVTPFADLEVAPYLGLWYEERRMYSIWETKQDCNTAIYSDLGYWRNAAGEYKDIYGQAVVSAPGILSLTFPGRRVCLDFSKKRSTKPRYNRCSISSFRKQRS